MKLIYISNAAVVLARTLRSSHPKSLRSEQNSQRYQYRRLLLLLAGFKRERNSSTPPAYYAASIDHTRATYLKHGTRQDKRGGRSSPDGGRERLA